MFGFGQDAAAKKRISDMAAMIRGTADSFGQIAALHATLNRVSGRDPGDRYLGAWAAEHSELTAASRF